MQIFADPNKQADYDALLKRMTRKRYELARALYATERAGRFDGFDEMPDEDIAPIYRILANNLIENEANRFAIMALLETVHD